MNNNEINAREIPADESSGDSPEISGTTEVEKKNETENVDILAEIGKVDVSAEAGDVDIPAGDHIVTATAADGAVRITACESTSICEDARRIHGTSAVMTAALGRTLTAASLLSSQLKNATDSLTVQINGKGPGGKIICITDPDGNVRGYCVDPAVELPLREKDGKLDVGGAVGKGFLQIIKDLSLKEPYQGTSALVSGEIGEDISYYFAVSEQVPTTTSLGVRICPDPEGVQPFVVEKAGGFLLQLMPGAPDDLIGDLEARLGAMPSVTTLLAAGASVNDIVGDILTGYSPEIKAVKPIRYKCSCSRERMQAALCAIGRSDLQEILDDGKGAEICCRFCNRKYFFDNGDIRAMIDAG